MTPGNLADITMAVPILEALAPTRRLIADKAYDADRLRTWLQELLFRAVPLVPLPIRSIAQHTDAVTSLSGCSAISRTGSVSQLDMTGWLLIILPPLSSSRQLLNGLGVSPT